MYRICAARRPVDEGLFKALSIVVDYRKRNVPDFRNKILEENKASRLAGYVAGQNSTPTRT